MKNVTFQLSADRPVRKNSSHHQIEKFFQMQIQRLLRTFQTKWVYLISRHKIYQQQSKVWHVCHKLEVSKAYSRVPDNNLGLQWYQTSLKILFHPRNSVEYLRYCPLVNIRNVLTKPSRQKIELFLTALNTSSETLEL